MISISYIRRQRRIWKKSYDSFLVLLLIIVANAMIELNDWLNFVDRQQAFIDHNWMGVMSPMLLIVLGVAVMIIFRKAKE